MTTKKDKELTLPPEGFSDIWRKATKGMTRKERLDSARWHDEMMKGEKMSLNTLKITKKWNKGNNYGVELEPAKGYELKIDASQSSSQHLFIAHLRLDEKSIWIERGEKLK